MKKSLILSLLLIFCLSRAQAQGTLVITSPDPLEQCSFNSGTIQLTVSPYDPAFTYEWHYESYQNFQSGGYADDNILTYGQNALFLPGSYPNRCTIISCNKLDNNGFPVDFGSVNVRCWGDVIPYLTYYTNCGLLGVPAPYADFNSGNPPVWARWFKNGVVQPNSGGAITNLTTANYQYKMALNCGDTISTPVIPIVSPQFSASINASGPLTFCQGGSVSLSIPSNVDFTYQWKLNGTNIQGATSTTLLVTASGSYTVQATNLYGCINLAAPVVVNVQAGAVISASATLACSGDSILLLSNTATTYQWKLNNVNIPGATSQSYKTVVAGNYKVVTTGLTCNTSNTVALSFTPAPTVNLTASGPLAILSGTGITLTANVTNTTSYKWYLNGNLIPGETPSSMFVTQAGGYKCAASNAVCEKLSSPKTVSVIYGNQLPQKTLTLQPGIASGKDAYVYNQAPTGNNGSSGTLFATWYNSNGNLLVTRSYLQFDLTGISPGTIINSAKLNLYGNPGSTNYPNNSTYLDAAKAAWSENVITWGNQPEVTTYNRLSIAGTSAPTQDWTNLNVKGSVIGMVNNPTTNYGWRLWLQNELSGGTLVIASSDNGTAALRPKLVINYAYARIDTSGPASLCTGDSVTLTTNAGPYTYLWKKNGATISGATGQSYTAKSSGTYKVIITDPGGVSVTSIAKTVTVSALPSANITPLGPVTFCNGDSVKLQANTGTGLTYKWKKNGSFIAGATSASYVAKTAGNFKVDVTNSGGCSKLSSAITVAIPCRTNSLTGVPLNQDAKAMVYPNPTRNAFNVFVESENGSAFVCNIYDIRGRKINSFSFVTGQELKFGSELDAGMYVVELKSDLFVRKIIVVKE